MIVTEEIYNPSGDKFIKTYSDANMMIRQDDTGNLYAEAVDSVEWPHTYTETDIPIEPEPEPDPEPDSTGNAE